MKTNKRTQKELKPMIKRDVDAFVLEMIEKYPEISGTSLEEYIADTAKRAFYDLTEFGKIRTNWERWGK